VCVRLPSQARHLEVRLYIVRSYLPAPPRGRRESCRAPGYSAVIRERRGVSLTLDPQSVTTTLTLVQGVMTEGRRRGAGGVMGDYSEGLDSLDGRAVGGGTDRGGSERAMGDAEVRGRAGGEGRQMGQGQ
jgi:hypothetical protein